MLELILLSVFFGIILTLIVQYLLFYWLTSFPAATGKWKSQSDPFVLPENLFKIFGDLKEVKDKEEACRSLNFIFQFLFQELKDAEHVRRWAEKRLKNEFSELLQSTTGKLLDDIRVRGFNLGRTFPVVRDFHLSHVDINEDNALNEVSMLLDLTYSGRFQLAIDVDTVFGKSAYLSVTVTKLQGTARLQLTTTPYRHWSFAFTEDPLLEFEVESHFEGRPIARLASLVTSQIKRQIRKKHTLPNYKMRYKPFFVLPTPKVEPQDVFYDGSRLSVGKLNVVVVGCTRLLQMPSDSFIFCSLAIDSMPWSELMNVKRKSWVTCECELVKTSPQLGFTFEDTFSLNKFEEAVVVTSVTPGSPAARANIQKNDILASINGMKVASSKQASRIIRQSSEKVVLRIEREKSSSGTSVEGSKSAESSSLIKVPSTDSLNSYSREIDLKEISSGVINIDGKVKGSSGPKDSSSASSGSKLFNGSPMLGRKEMENSGLPKLNSAASLQSVNSNVSLPGEAKELKNVESSASKETVSESFPNRLNKSEQSTNGEPLEENLHPKMTRLFKSCQSPVFNQRFQFDVKEQHSYLNICIWCRETEKLDKQSRLIKMEKDNLLGHVSIPLMDIALECLATLQGDFTSSFNVTPSQTKIGMGRQQHPTAATHPGFEERLCHGDVLLRFQYSRGDEGDPDGCNLEIFDSFHKKEGGLPFVMVPSTASSKAENAPIKLHNFQPSQFQSAVYCKFCSKKIWFKSAFMCTNCKMVCHKKCIEKCQVQTNCSKTGVPKQPSNGAGATDRKRHLSAPDDKKEGTTVETAAPSLESNSLTRKSSSSSLKDLSTSESQADTHAAANVKKVRGTPFWTNQGVADENADEKIVTEAKLAGRKLYTELDVELRKERFDEVIQTTQLEIERESKHHGEIQLAVDKQMDKKQKTLLLNKLKNSEDKLKSLKVLMLQFCAGLQHCLDEEELLRQRMVREAEDEAKLVDGNSDELPSALPQQHPQTISARQSMPEDVRDSLIADDNEAEPFLREAVCRNGKNEVVEGLNEKADRGLLAAAAAEGGGGAVFEVDETDYVEAILKYGEEENKLDVQMGLADDENSESEQQLDMEGQAFLAFEQLMGNSRSLSPDDASDQSRSSPEADEPQALPDCAYLDSVETGNVGTVDLDSESIGDKINAFLEGDASCLNKENKPKDQSLKKDEKDDDDRED